MPWRGLLPFTPDNRISTEPSFKVVTVQLRNRFWEQLISSAGTPFSMSFSEVQFTPEVFVKNTAPRPFSGVLNVKLSPTFVQPCWHELALADPPPCTPRMTILGSLIPSANAKLVQNKATRTSK